MTDGPNAAAYPAGYAIAYQHGNITTISRELEDRIDDLKHKYSDGTLTVPNVTGKVESIPGIVRLASGIPAAWSSAAKQNAVDAIEEMASTEETHNVERTSLVTEAINLFDQVQDIQDGSY